MTEKLRFFAAVMGLAWWIAFPFIYFAGSLARREHRCAGRTFTGTFDDCFNDALPVLEVGAFPLTLILAYPFARFAFSMFGPESDLRTLKWRLAGSGGGVEYFPLFQIVSAIGMIWAVWHFSSIPLESGHWFLLIYWIIWISWFAIGAYASSPFSRHTLADGN